MTEKPEETHAGTEETATSAPRESGQATFASLVMSLAMGALTQLESGTEAGKAQTPDLNQARALIDMLEVLREKTRGNLTPEEEHLLGSMLFDLQVRYLKAMGTDKEQPGSEQSPSSG
ncbi:MAG: DUF1844 domain-containing protein [candidate division WOR-3 bacterium]